MVVVCVQGNEHSCFVKGKSFLDKLSEQESAFQGLCCTELVNGRQCMKLNLCRRFCSTVKEIMLFGNPKHVCQHHIDE